MCGFVVDWATVYSFVFMCALLVPLCVLFVFRFCMHLWLVVAP